MKTKKNVILLTGGARSGKSTRALELAAKVSGQKYFIATAEAGDEEMGRRIEIHRRQRDDSFITIEAPLNLATAIKSLPTNAEIAIIDCLTIWTSNLMQLHADQPEDQSFPETDEFLKILGNPPCPLIVVSNELGLGIVPANPLARRFRDVAGRLNQQVAALADQVEFLVSGLPLTLKGS
jgi:adenosylcobinamide kinase / adenosylcobinamide-phosphate guanylyltransferase